jgi:hypothetical protein
MKREEVFRKVEITLKLILRSFRVGCLSRYVTNPSYKK